MAYRTILGEEAKSLGRQAKWDLLSAFVRQHGREALSYPTLQDGMEYFIDDDRGYIAFVTVRHPLLARRPKRIVLCDPMSAPADYAAVTERFLADEPRAAFGVISETYAACLRRMGFKANCIGYEPELPIQTYNTRGNWHELDLIKRARNEVRRQGLTIQEVDITTVDRAQLAAVTDHWIGTKRIHNHEIWLYARRPIFELEPDVRKFVAYDRERRVAGFVFYDPMYRDGRVVGYAANISRCDEQRFGRLTTATHMVAIDQFRSEGKEVLNLALAPFVRLELGKFNDDPVLRAVLQLSARFGNDIYNFQGLAFHKSKYRGAAKPIYLASKALVATNDIYLAFYSADITRSYGSMIWQLLRGMLKAPFQKAEKGRQAKTADHPGPDQTDG